MLYNIRKLIRESIESELLCEVKIEIDDTKHRGFAEQLGKMYKKALKPIKIYGKLGIPSAHSGDDASIFEVTLANGDIIKALRNTNPAFGNIKIGDKEFFINSKELFSNKFPDLLKKYYLLYKTAKAGIPSI